ncbi:penicillin acylase family protein [Pseudobacteriovorax antillogorgiicola]|uniref:Penicillin amidase n=1 Tax=Pseudobacteriovorax antillogorgiicola TaxID=1513793 RepID=A0A1Y6C7Z4_9BACT|nr:penicillin acylase family protein [Pseudobacteriovorax antillogorgiicola]TCS51747.1 penicillin amidase [Pseudobacteriovorax antillogorgiicola]SMF49681.1 penicillin amidase [Pseudobacteriovorax antillogorgiicola]
MRVIKVVILSLFTTCILAVAGAFWYEYEALPMRSGEIKSVGIKGDTQVIFNQWGVPHINAESRHDAYFALGYLHAQDRLLQMEGIRRIAQGRIAEIAGPERLETDIFFRSLGIHRMAKDLVASADLKHPAFQDMSSYLAGVNNYVETGKLPLEVLLGPGRPQPFTLEDIISAAAYISYTFDRGLKTDLWLYQAGSKISPAHMDDLDFGADSNNLSHRQPEVSRLFRERIAQVEESIDTYGRFQGSNAWVVSGEKSQSGKPMLANDTHIRFSNPSIWYEAYLKAPDLEIYGHFLPLISLPLLGNNSSHGWGLTIFHNNDIDLILETPDPHRPGHILRGEQSIPLASRPETIKVRGEEPHQFTVLSSDKGPIMDHLLDGQLLSVRWTFQQVTPETFHGLYELLSASDIASAEAAVQKIAAPSLNVLYANRSGDIGWWTTGLIPQLNRVEDHFQVAAADKFQTSFRSLNSNPHQVNPAKGFLSSANEQPADGVPGYYSYPERAQRLEFLLGNARSFTVDDFKRFQNDTKISFHQPLVIALKRTLSRQDPKVLLSKEAIAILDRWEGEHHTQDIAPTIFSEYIYQLVAATFRDEMGAELFEEFIDREIALKSLMSVSRKPYSPWWNNVETQYRETMNDVIIEAWRKTLRALSEKYGQELQTWVWGRHHQVSFDHPLGKIPVLGLFLNLGPYPAPGGMETLNQIAYRFGTGSANAVHGPATRRIIDFAKPEESLSVLPTGQSGRFLDPHYRDQVDSYLSGTYRRALLNPDPSTEGYSQLWLKPQIKEKMQVSTKAQDGASPQ